MNKQINAIIFFIFLAMFACNAVALGNQTVNSAFKTRTSNIQVTDTGVVIKVLPDDNIGSRHQKFLLKLASGQTILIAHNIDLAPKITSLKRGDTLKFYGEYEWSAKGGVVHWTHHDPAGRHPGGWLEHNGKKYQ
ncbi:MAG: DUF3465 domain-containing protein [Algicola sp.]|nr:DUF3465 domain-containing protein [Algicola sp.]